jgi:hypothetical protein
MSNGVHSRRRASLLLERELLEDGMKSHHSSNKGNRRQDGGNINSRNAHSSRRDGVCSQQSQRRKNAHISLLVGGFQKAPNKDRHYSRNVHNNLLLQDGVHQQNRSRNLLLLNHLRLTSRRRKGDGVFLLAKVYQLLRHNSNLGVNGRILVRAKVISSSNHRNSSNNNSLLEQDRHKDNKHTGNGNQGTNALRSSSSSSSNPILMGNPILMDNKHRRDMVSSQDNIMEALVSMDSTVNHHHNNNSRRVSLFRKG